MEFKAKDNKEFDSYVEEELWGHIQLSHETIFEEVQDFDTSCMLEECYTQIS